MYFFWRRDVVVENEYRSTIKKRRKEEKKGKLAVEIYFVTLDEIELEKLHSPSFLFLEIWKSSSRSVIIIVAPLSPKLTPYQIEWKIFDPSDNPQTSFPIILGQRCRWDCRR